MLNVRAEPTHVLVIEVPLNLNEPPRGYDPIKDSITLALSISRAAFEGRICDDAQVSLREP